MAPARSRVAWAWPMWAAMALGLVESGYVFMGVYTIMLASTYARPSELLRLEKGCLLPPVHGVSDSWAALLNPADKVANSKTGAADESLVLNNSWLRWLDPAYKILSEGAPHVRVFTFDYPAYFQEFVKIRKKVGDQSLNGPSIDFASHERTIQEIQKRWRWASQRSLVRYEQSAKLAREWRSLGAETRQACERAAATLPDALLGRSSGRARRGP